MLEAEKEELNRCHKKRKRLSEKWLKFFSTQNNNKKKKLKRNIKTRKRS